MIGRRLRKMRLAFLVAVLCTAAPAGAVQDGSIGTGRSAEPVAQTPLSTPRQDRLDANLQIAADETLLPPSQPLPPKLPASELRSVSGDAEAGPVLERGAETPIHHPEGVNTARIPKKLRFDAFITGLFEFQDAIVAGDPSALALQGKVLRRLQANLISERQIFSEMDAPVEPLLVFALSGGDARVSVELLERIPNTHPVHPLAQSVIAYLKGNPDSARSLAQHDPSHFAFPLSAILALSTGTANAPVNPAIAAKALEMAAILGTGTLVEEVSLRRLLEVYEKTGDETAFLAVAESYGLRFPRSLFLNEYARRLSLTLVENNWAPPHGLAPILEWMRPEQSTVIAREIARGAAIKGEHRLALMGTEWLRRFEQQPRADDQLYEAMAQLAAQNIDRARQIDAAIATDQLAERDRPLLVSLRLALRHITEGPAIADLPLGRQMSSHLPVLKAELQPEHRMGKAQHGFGITPPASMPEPPAAAADTEIADLRERLSATMDAIQKLSTE